FHHYPGYRLAMFPGREVDLIKDLGIDVIHIHGVGFVGIKGLWASWQAKIPRVSTFHTMIHDTLAFYSPFGLNLHLLERGLRFYLKIFLRKTQGVVVPSRAILDAIMPLSPRANIADVIPPGVDPARVRPGRGPAEVLRGRGRLRDRLEVRDPGPRGPGGAGLRAAGRGSELPGHPRVRPRGRERCPVRPERRRRLCRGDPAMPPRPGF